MPTTAHSQSARPTLLSLDLVPPEKRVQVVAVEGGRDIAGLLAQLHVRVGAALRVVRSAPLGGPLLVECGGGTVIISRRLAERVRVQVLP